MSVSPERNEKSNLVQFPCKIKKHPGRVGSFIYESGLGLLSGHIPKTTDIALEMVAFCECEFDNHGIETDQGFDFQNELIRLVERYSKINKNP